MKINVGLEGDPRDVRQGRLEKRIWTTQFPLPAPGQWRFDRPMAGRAQSRLCAPKAIETTNEMYGVLTPIVNDNGTAEPTELSTLKLMLGVQLNDRQRFQEAIKQPLTSTEIVDFSNRIVRPDSTVYWLWRKHNVVEIVGRIVRMVGMEQDVTEHQATEAKLLRNAQRAAAVNELGQGLMTSLDLEVVCQRLIDALERMLGIRAAYILLRDDEEYVVAAGIHHVKWQVGKRVGATDNVVAQVIATGKYVRLRGEEAIGEVYEHRGEFLEIKPGALMAVPLEREGTIIGILEVIHTQSDAFDREACQMLEAIAVWAAIAIDNARQHDQLRHRLHKSEALALISQTLVETPDLERILPLIAETAQLIVQDAEAAAIHLLDDEAQLMNLSALSGLTLKPAAFTIEVQDSVAGQAIQGARVVNIARLQDTAGPSTIEARMGIESVLVAPLHGRSGQQGTISVYAWDQDRFSADDEWLLSRLALHATMAIENARLYTGQERARRMSEALRSANIGLTLKLELDSVLDVLLDYLHQFINYDTANVMLLENETTLRFHAVRGYEQWLDPKHIHYQTVEVADYPHIQALMASGQSLIIAETRNYPGWKQRVVEVEHVRSWLGVPLIVGGKILGLYAMDHRQPHFFTEQHRFLAEALAGQASIAVQNAKLFEQVRIGHERLRQLTQQAVSAQEEERQRVSRELHDDAGQALTALKISLGLIKNNLPAEMELIRHNIQEAADLADQTMERIRLLAQNLRPPALDTLGLNLSLEGLCHDFARRTGISIKYTGVDLEALEESPSISLYRFLQEALTNVAKHADASEVDVALRVESGMISLSITDYGKGFTLLDTLYLAESVGGIGLIGMQERFELLGGRVVVDSELGRGTRVVAYVPYQEG